jgi:KDO2-lipid IV(A) lauroyltransferase
MRLLAKFFINIFVFVASLMPRRMLRSCGTWVGFLWFDVFRLRRKIVLDNIRIALPEIPKDQATEIGRQSVYMLGRNLTELFQIPSMNEEWIEKNVVIEGLSYLEEAKKQGKGVLILTLHLGNGDIAANVVTMKALPIHMITKRFKSKWLDDLWFSIRGAQGVKYIDAHGQSNAFDILKALRKNAGVVFVLDQFMGRPFGIASTFFGRTTGTAYGLALFSQKTQAPVIPIYTFEGSDKKLHVVIEPAIDTSEGVVEDRDKTLLILTERFNRKLEEIIRKHPEQWMWVHRRWKDFT